MPRDLNVSDVHALAGAYALDALTELERAAFARHVEGCESCALEVAELQETASRLTVETVAVPPPRLREAVLAEVARTPQARNRRRADEARAVGAAVVRWRRWTAAAVAAGIIAVGAAVGTWAVDEQGVRAARAEAQRMTDVLGAPDASVHRTTLAGGQVTVVVSPSRNKGVAVLSGLADPGSGKAYQLWLIQDKTARPAGLLDPGERDATKPIGPIDDADTFAVSLEDAGGSTTGQPANGGLGGLPLL